MITYQFTNAVTENSQMRVFFRFSNGEECSNLFELTATVLDINTWAKEKAKFYEEREDLIRNHTVSVVEELIIIE